MVLVVNNFRAGEISARVDRLKSAEIVQNGLLKAQNVVINPQGGARKRPGLKYITTLPTGRQWRRIFAWDKSQEERLNICYADTGEFKVLQEGGALIDVSGLGNSQAGDDMQFQIVGNRAVFTDGREPKHILANTLNVSPEAILLTSEMTAALFPVKPLRDFLTAADDYTPPADQPITLSEYSDGDKSALLEVGELRSTFTPNAQGRATVFTNKVRTYKQGNSNTTITINSINREGGAGAYRLRLSLSAFPAWLEKAVVRWSANANAPALEQYKRSFSRSGLADGDFAPIVVAQATWTASASLGAGKAGYGFIGGVLAVSNNALTGALPSDTSGNWRLRQVGGAHIDGALTITPFGSADSDMRIGTAEQMQAAFGNANITSGGDFVLEKLNANADGRLQAAELAEWNNARGAYSVELVRRIDDAITHNAHSITTAAVWNAYIAPNANIAHGNAIFQANTAFNTYLWASVNTVSGVIPPYNTHNVTLRQVGGASITGTMINGGSGSTYVITSKDAMRAVFGNESIVSGGQWVMSTPTDRQTTGAINLQANGVTITEISLQNNSNTLRVTAQGLSAGRRFVINVGGQIITFGAGALTKNLTAAEATAWRGGEGNISIVNFTIRAENANLGLEANDRDFFALATSEGAPYYIRGRDFYRLNNAGGLVRQPLKDRRVTGLIVLDRAQDSRAAVLLREYRERVLPRITQAPRQYAAATLAGLLQVSDFIAFRPPVLNPPVILFDDDSAFTAEETRIGKRFCIRTDQVSGGSLTSGEYELEWVANVPVDEYGSQLTPVGTNGSARPELVRRGITDTYEDRATNPPTERTVTGWKYGTSADIPANLRSTIVNSVGVGSNNLPPSENYNPFNNTAIDAWGTLVARKIADNAATIGKPPGRYAMVWNDTDGYPLTASLPQNRLAYAGSRTHPARIWMSVIGEPHNFLDFRPEANDAKGIVVRPDYAVRLDLDTAAIRSMENDAALLIFTQNEAHVANGPFNAENLASSHTRRFGRLGQEFNIGSAIIDENVFIFANGAPFGLLYDGIDIGYISQNLSAQRNDDIMRNYDDRVITAEGGTIYPVGALADLSAIDAPADAKDNEDLRPVRIVATQPQGLNGAYLVLFLMSDGTIRAFQTLHREGFFAWSRWDFFAEQNAPGGVDLLGAARRKIIDISAQGRLVTLLDSDGVIYTLDGEQAWDDLDAAAVAADDSDKHEIGVEIELPTYALADPRFPGQALIHPKRVEYAVLHFNRLSGYTIAQATDSELKTKREIPAEPSFAGVAGRRDRPEDEEAQTIFLHAQRRVQMSQAQDRVHDSDKRFTITVTNTSKEAWELLRAESELEISTLIPQGARAAAAKGGG